MGDGAGAAAGDRGGAAEVNGARYTVEAYDNFDHSGERSCSKVGEFLQCARDVLAERRSGFRS